MKILVLVLFFAGVSFILVLVARSRHSPAGREIVVGGLYTWKSDDGSYRVEKILAVDSFAVHVRIYRNKFKDLPRDLDTSVLSLGGLRDPEGFGIGHAPLAREGFWRDAPVFLKMEPVREEELEGYRAYLEEMKK